MWPLPLQPPMGIPPAGSAGRPSGCSGTCSTGQRSIPPRKGSGGFSGKAAKEQRVRTAPTAPGAQWLRLAPAPLRLCSEVAPGRAHAGQAWSPPGPRLLGAFVLAPEQALPFPHCAQPSSSLLQGHLNLTSPGHCTRSASSWCSGSAAPDSRKLTGFWEELLHRAPAQHLVPGRDLFTSCCRRAQEPLGSAVLCPATHWESDPRVQPEERIFPRSHSKQDIKSTVIRGHPPGSG